MKFRPEPPKTELQSLAAALRGRGPAAALPKNLDDFWLRSITRDLMKAQLMLQEENSADFDKCIAAPLYVVLKIVEAKQASTGEGSAELLVSEDQLPALFEELQFLAEQEIIARATGVYHRVKSQTLEGVFARTFQVSTASR